MTGIIIGYAGFWGAAFAQTATGSVTAQYTCTQQGAGVTSGTATWDLSSTFPGTVTVNRPTPQSQFTATEEIPASTVQQMRTYYNIDSVSGNGTVAVVDATPQGNISKTLSYTVPRTPLPASGPAKVTAYGLIPPYTFTRPGTSKVTMGTITANATAYSNGSPSSYGTQSTTCTPESGHNVTVQTFQIIPAPKPPAPAPAPVTTRPQPSPPRPTQSHSPSPTRTHHPSPSASPSRGTIASPAATPGSFPRTINGKQAMIIGAGALVLAGTVTLTLWLALRNRI